MKKTAMIVVAALMVTFTTTMAFASIAERQTTEAHKQMVQQRHEVRMEKNFTEEQKTEMDEIATNYFDSITDLVKETAKMRIELDNLKDTVNPDPQTVQTMERELWEKTAQLAEANQAFKAEMKTVKQ